MLIQCRLKKWPIVQHDIYRPNKIFLQALTKFLGKTPKQLKIETIQAISTAFNCKLTGFCEIIPSFEFVFSRAQLQDTD